MGELVARLSRFYGGDPWRWLSEVPIAVVRASRALLPRLEAEESILAVDRVAVATGSLPEGKGPELFRAWRKLADPAAPRPATPASSPRARATDAELHALGIRVVRVQKAPA